MYMSFYLCEGKAPHKLCVCVCVCVCVFNNSKNLEEYTNQHMVVTLGSRLEKGGRPWGDFSLLVYVLLSVMSNFLQPYVL